MGANYAGKELITTTNQGGVTSRPKFLCREQD